MQLFYHKNKKNNICNSHLVQELHLAESEKLIAKNVFGEDEGLSGFRSRR